MGDTPTLETDRGAFPALVETRAADSALLELVKQRAPNVDDDFLAEHEPYFWTAKISNSRVDSYSTHMDRTSLRNYAEDAEAGVPFMNSHRTGGFLMGSAELPLGRSLNARFVAGQKTGEPHTEATFYTFSGMRLGEVATDDFITGLRSGVVSDVSIGFMQARYVCDLCGEDMMRSETCTHFPGMTYDVETTDDKGKKRVERVKCTVAVHDARLAEVSAVYKGSTPGAMIVKATRMAEAKQFSPTALSLLEDQYRILLPGSPRTWYTAGANPPAPAPTEPAKEQEEMGERQPETQDPAADALRGQLEQIRAAFGAPSGTDLVVFAGEAAERLANSEAEVARLQPLAADGEEYRKTVVAEAITEGKRAFGEGFNEESYTALFASAPLPSVRAARDNFRQMADKLFPTQRVTTDDDEGEDKDEEKAPRRPARSRRAYSA
jgi:hypothetical protein